MKQNNKKWIIASLTAISFNISSANAQTIPFQDGFNGLIQDGENPQAQQGPLVTGVESLELTQNAWNDILRNRGESKKRPGYVRYIYDAQQAFPIRAREGMVTTIKLPEGETILQAFAGDEAGFQVGIPTPQTVVIKAIFPGVDSNLIVYAESGNIFTFYLRSYSFNAKEISDFLVDVVSPTGKKAYTGSQMDFLTPEQLANYDLNNPAAAARRIRDPYSTLSALVGTKFEEYAEWTDFNPSTIEDDLGVFVPLNQSGGIIPYRVFRDDRFTYIDYGPNAPQINEWPTPLIVIQGVEGPVGYRTAGPSGRMLVLEARGEFVLRNGQRIIIIKNKNNENNENLVQYATYDQSELKVPTNLPPGRQTIIQSEPKTIVPIYDGQITSSNELPSRVQIIKSTKEDGKAETKLPSIDRNEVIISGNVEKIPVAKGDGFPIINVTPSENNNNLITGQNNTNLSNVIRYRINLGEGSRDVLENNWKSIKVQYYDNLLGKDPSYVINNEGALELHLIPFNSVNEAINLCDKMQEQSVCNVEIIK